MLTAEWVRARRRGGELQISALKGPLRERALEIATTYVRLMRGVEGKTRGEVQGSLGSVPVAPREHKIAGGLRKLIEDRSRFEVEAGVDAPKLRQQVFERAAETRRALSVGEPFDRGALLEALALEHDCAPHELERRLYADLKDAHQLVEYAPASAEALVAQYELGQAQAVLLKALRVRLDVRCASPAAYRRFFHKLKFLRLLYRIERRDGGGYHIEIDGPFSLFRSSTKYGLKLALLLPVIRECDTWAIEADVRWGKDRRELLFRQEGERAKSEGGAHGRATPADRPEEVRKLVERWRKKDGGWDVAWAKELFTLPGVGECVPDLRFTHQETGFTVRFEVLGYWSRAAVFKRVELVEAGLETPILFAASSRLRVSEELLPEDVSSGLYVYKGSLDRASILGRLEALRSAAIKVQ